MSNLSLRFVRWGAVLLLFGLWTGYGPLAHYLHGGVHASCPWAPVHAHVVLLGWVGLTLFGLVYRRLPDWGTVDRRSLALARIHFVLSVTSVAGVFANGIIGYRVLDRLAPGFYYEPKKATLNLWLSIDGWFLTGFALGCVLFLIVVFRSTRYERNGAEPVRRVAG